MQSYEIEHYLAELGVVLRSQGIKKPVRMHLIGGAYMMLLAHASRTTDDVDVCLVEEGEGFHKARLAMRDGVQAIANKHRLPPHWFNYLTQHSSLHGTGSPTHLSWRRPLDRPWELYQRLVW